MSNLPPKPVLALTVAVAGHRLDRSSTAGAPRGPAFDVKAVRAAMDEALSMLKCIAQDLLDQSPEWFAPHPPLIAIVTSLGEGADRVGAEAAMAHALPFDAVLPFQQEAYEQTFQNEQSREEFRALMGEARATLVLPDVAGLATEAARSRAYEQGGATLLAQSDILIVVWDGQPALGLGGTGETVEEAARLGTPVLIIDPGGAARLCWRGDFEFPLAARHADELIEEKNLEQGFRKIISGLVLPAGYEAGPSEPRRSHRLAAKLERLVAALAARRSADEGALVRRSADWLAAALASFAGALARTPGGEGEIDGLRVYFRTPITRVYRHRGWAFLRRCLGVARRLDAAQSPPAPASVAASAPPSNQAENARLRSAATAADLIGVHFADAFRTSFFWNFLFGALAVVFVAWTLLAPREGRALPAAGEFACIIVVVAGTSLARWRQWRRRWFEAREAAERLRMAESFWSLGVWPETLSAKQSAWTGWYVRSILREQPVFSADLSLMLTDLRRKLIELVEAQRRYHAKTASEAEQADRALERVGILCVVASFLEPVLFVFAHVFGLTLYPTLDRTATFLAIVLPALATASYGIRQLGDFEDTARRSRRTMRKLDRLSGLLGGESATLPELRARARQALAAMLADVESWRVAVESRNLSF
ncbi:MAG TPA: hypothetical protein VKS78_04690 [Roseiarcus sp.]|nr:hypothetical protein [Roseiarcus sp.]